MNSPGLMHQDSQQRLWLDTGDKLQVYSPEESTGRLLSQYSRKAMNSDGTGDFLPLSNGRVLLAKQGYDPSLLDNLLTWFRMQPVSDDQDKERWLQSCNPDTSNCYRIGGDEPIAMPRSYRLLEIPDEDAFVLVDTSRHRLLRYSLSGELQATSTDTSTTELRFPNSVRWVGNRLMVADTNHHRIVFLDAGIETFGKLLEEHRVLPEKARRKSAEWPTDVVNMNDSWFVLLKEHDMTKGGIYRFSADWSYSGMLELPENSDVIALAVWNNQLLATDWEQRVMSFSGTGERLEDFTSLELTASLENNIAEREHWSLIEKGFALVAVFSFIAGFVVAVRQAVNLEPGQTVPVPEDTAAGFVWLKPKTKGLRIFAVICVLATVAILPMLVVPDLSVDLRFICGGVIGFMLCSVWLLWVASRARIGVCGDIVVLEDHHGERAAARGDMLMCNERVVVAGDKLILLGNAHKGLFDAQELRTHLWPALKDARNLSEGEQMMKMIQARHPVGIFTLVALLGILLWFLFMN